MFAQRSSMKLSGTYREGNQNKEQETNTEHKNKINESYQLEINFYDIKSVVNNNNTNIMWASVTIPKEVDKVNSNRARYKYFSLQGKQ